MPDGPSYLQPPSRVFKSPSLYDVHVVRQGDRLRPYHVEYTSSRPITEVKQRRARLVLGWVTAWEYRVS